jgi:hypothetical protein
LKIGEAGGMNPTEHSIYGQVRNSLLFKIDHIYDEQYERHVQDQDQVPDIVGEAIVPTELLPIAQLKQSNHFY